MVACQGGNFYTVALNRSLLLGFIFAVASFVPRLPQLVDNQLSLPSKFSHSAPGRTEILPLYFISGSE